MRIWRNKAEKMVDAAATAAVAGQLASNEAEVPLGESSGLRFVFRFLRKDRASLVSMSVVAVFFGYAAIEGLLQMVGDYMKASWLGFVLVPSNPIITNFKFSLLAPGFGSIAGLLGYDFDGRSILSQIMYAAPRDAVAAVVIVGSAIVIGMLLGITAGYIGGWADEILMRVTDAFLAFPGIFLAIALAILLGNGYTIVLIALIVVWWPPYARYFRAQTLRERNRGYVEASKLSGISSLRIMSRHIFPNTIDPIVAIASLDLGNVILTYSTLAFLGIGLELGLPEWGSMTSDGFAYIPGVWWWALFPALAIMIIVVCFSIIGDRIQDLVGGRLSY